MRDEFIGVFLPRGLCLDKGLSWTERVLLNEIHSFEKKSGRGCFAGNGHFAELLGVTPGTAANMISDLKKREYVVQISFDGKNRSLGIKPNMLHLFVKHISKNLHKNVSEPSRKNDQEPSRKNEQKNTSSELKNSLRKNLTELPEDFGITGSMRAWFAANCPRLDIDFETEQFKDRCRSKGTEYKDWVAGWRTQMKNAEKWSKSEPSRPVAVRPEPSIAEKHALAQEAVLRQPPGRVIGE